MATKTLIKLMVAFSLLSIKAMIVAENTATTPIEPANRNSGNKTDIPAGKCEHMMSGAIMLNLENVGLRHLGSNFTASPSVGCLDLENNDLSNVSTSAFSLMPNLLYLNLAQNNISLSQISALESHFQLRTLILDNNNQSSSSKNLSFSMFNTFPHLTYLYLRNLSIADFQSLKFAPRLSHLYLSSNQLGSSSEEEPFFEDAPATLSLLDLADNRLRSLNVTKFGSSLQELRLEGNRIEKVCGKTYCAEPALHLRSAVSLMSLSLSRNGLTSVEPDAFDASENLIHLDLSHNRIGSVRKNTFENCGRLRNLSLENNTLTDIPDIFGCDSLTHLSLAYNKIKIVSNETFLGNSQLIFVDLSHNRITSIDVEAFKNQKLLDQLNISHNKIKILPNSWTTPLISLRILRVNDNRLENLEDLRLAGARANWRLAHVYLQNNLITKLHTSALYNVLRMVPNVALEILDSSNLTSVASLPLEEPETCECNCDKINEIEDSNEKTKDNSSTDASVASFFG